MSEIKLRPIVFKVVPPPPPVPTVRVRTSDGNAPIKGQWTSYETATLVSGTADVYDVCKSGTDLSYLLYHSTNVTEVLAVNNTSSVTNMEDMFGECTSLTTVPLFDTSNATNLGYMFEGCEALTSIPLFDTSKATSTTQMFINCKHVQSGAYALYEQASSQANPPTNHSAMFQNCGINTSGGYADLDMIPSDWK